MTENAEATNPVTSSKPVKDRDGHVYKDAAEKMMYYMRRRRGATLPHYPAQEPTS